MAAELEQRMMAAARDGKISCAMAFRIAKETNVSIKRVGKLADKLKIKIRTCQLGCFP